MRAFAALLTLGLAIGCVQDPGPAYKPGDPFCTSSAAITTEEQFGWTLPDKTLALTFDDGPGDRTTELSTFLRDQGILGTFFVNGQWVTGDFEFQAHVLDELANDGHLLANHSTTHRALTELVAEDIVAEVEQTDDLIMKYTPPEKLFFRPPFGSWNAEVAKALKGSPMGKYVGPVHWDIGDQLTAKTAADWDCWDDEGNGKKTVAECAALYMREIHDKGRGIVLLHDGPPGSLNGTVVDMLKVMVPLLKLEGYEFVRLDEVSLRSRPPPPLNGNQNGGGPNLDPGAQPEPIDPCRGRTPKQTVRASFVDPASYACGGAHAHH